MPVSTFAALLLLASPPAGGQLGYEGDDPPMTSVRALDDKRLGTVLDDQLKAKGVTAKNVTTGAVGTADLPREVKQALLMAISMKPLSENDLMVAGGKGSFTPVQVIWEPTELAFSVGAAREKLYGPGPSAAELQKKYGIGEFVDDGVAWDSDMRFVVDLALARLSPGELALLKGLPFHRMPKATISRGPGRMLAAYRQESTLPRPRIELYDTARDADQLRFSGTVDAPVPQSAAMLAHELAHALSRAGAQLLLDEVKVARKELEDASNAFNEGQKQLDVDRAEFSKTKDPELGKSLAARSAATKDGVARVKELQKKWSDLQSAAQRGMQQSPIETAFLLKLPLKNAPTPYGRTLPSEAFAESYRLWKLDRAALERIAPGIAAWFESEAYVGLLNAR